MKRPVFYLMAFSVLFACSKEEIGPPRAINLSSVVTDASAFNAEDGAVDITISDEEGPIYYYWSNGSETEDVSGLFAGKYTLRITYGEEAFHEQEFTVTQPDPKPLDVQFEITDVSRFGKSDGAVEIILSGGTEPYTAIWEDLDTMFNYSELTAGTYKVKYTDNSSPYKIIDSATVSIAQPEFICGSDSIADIDGNLYPTVQIGEQCWMAENLRTAHLKAEVTTDIDGRYCAGSNCLNEKGAHYTWDVMMNGEAGTAAENPDAFIQGICPDGWAIPTRQMFRDLDALLSVDGNYGGGFFSGAKMKGADSPSGFDALYAGNWGYGVYSNDDIAAFWTSTEFFVGDEDEASDGYFFYVTDDTPLVNSGHKPKDFGLSIRCIKITTDE